jgi:hypothetical protein
MRLTVQLKLLPTPEQADALRHTLETTNEGEGVGLEGKGVGLEGKGVGLDRGETDLVFSNGSWYLVAACQIETPQPFESEGRHCTERPSPLGVRSFTGLGSSIIVVAYRVG